MRCEAAWLFVLLAIGACLISAKTAHAAGPTELVFWHCVPGSQGREFIKIVESFNSAQDEYAVRLVYVPWNSNQKIMSSLAAGMPPDIMYVDRPSATGWVARGAYQDLTSYVEREGWSDEQFFTISWEDCRFEGRQYMVPLYSDVRCLIYNRALFRKAGLDPDRPPKTWDELLEYSKRLSAWDEDGHIETLGFQHFESNAISNLILVLGWQLGADLANEALTQITLDDPRYLEAMEYICRLRDVTGLDPSLRLLSTGGQANEGMDSFYLGRVAMKLVESSYFVRQQDMAPHLDTALAPFPMPTDAPPVSWLSGFALGVPKGARNIEGSWAFIRYMCSVETQLALVKALGLLPARREAAYHPDVYSDANKKILVDQMDYCKCYPKIAVNVEAYNELCMATERVLRGQMKPAAALAQAQDTVGDVFRYYKMREAQPLLDWKPIVRVAVLGVVAAGVLLLVLAYRHARTSVAARAGLIAGYAFCLPWLLGVIFFGALPLFLSFVYSFCDYEVIQAPRWVGLGNYTKMLGDDPLFWKSMWNTLYYTLLAVPTCMAIALGLALLLNLPLRGMRLFRTVFYLPSLVTGVAVAVLWATILGPEYGIVNRTLEWLGITGPLWFNSPAWSKPALVLMSFWGVGGSMIIFLAGLQGIPRQLYEAAEIDGAGRWVRFVHVTLPMLSPTIFFVLVVGLIGSFQVFTQAFVVSGGLGGPLDSTLFYVFYVYRKAFEHFQMGYASALAWVLFAIVFALTTVQFWLGKKWVHYEQN